MTRIVAISVLAGAAALSACDTLGQAMTSHTDVLARAGGQELTVDEATALLMPHPHIPAQTDVIDALSNLWVDYMLLATAVNRDTTLANLNVDALLTPWMEQEVVFKLREQVIQVDTALSDEQLRAEYERDEPSAQVRASHILFRIPPDASADDRAAITQRAREVQAQAAAGEDFAQLARTHSQDPGSAQQGGDLDWFGRGQMVAPFEQAAFALRPGQVSELVESPFGLHIIKVEDRRAPAFEEVAEAYRMSALQQRVAEAEESYVRGLTEPRRIEVQDGAIEVAKELARKPTTQLGGRAANRPLVRYQGGALTAGHFRAAIRAWQPQQRLRLSSASDDQIEQVLEGLARNMVLVEEAHRRGLALTPTEQDSLRREARQQLRQAAQLSGLASIQPQDGETLGQAIERQVTAYINGILRGEQSVLPLGPLTFSLREQYGGEVYERAFPLVVSRLEAQRPPMQQFGQDFDFDDEMLPEEQIPQPQPENR